VLAEREFEVPVRTFNKLESELHVERAGIFAFRLGNQLNQCDADLASLLEQMLHERSSQTTTTSTEVLVDEYVFYVTHTLAPVTTDLEQRYRDHTIGSDLPDDTDARSSRIHEASRVEFSRRNDGARAQEVVPAFVEECDAGTEVGVVAIGTEVRLVNSELFWVEGHSFLLISSLSREI